MARKYYVEVSENVVDDFKQSDFYRRQMTRETAHWLLQQYLGKWYEYALKRGWTQQSTIADYVEHEHGAIYTAAFCLEYN